MNHKNLPYAHQQLDCLKVFVWYIAQLLKIGFFEILKLLLLIELVKIC